MKVFLICYVLILWKKRDKFILLRNEVHSVPNGNEQFEAFDQWKQSDPNMSNW